MGYKKAKSKTQADLQDFITIASHISIKNSSLSVELVSWSDLPCWVNTYTQDITFVLLSILFCL